MNVKIFLSAINLKLREEKPLVPDYLHYTIFSNNNFVEIWFKTQGCKYSNLGSCTFCDYWHSTNFEAYDMYIFVEKALNTLNFIPKTILLQTSGSVLDMKQVPYEIQKKIFNKLAQFQNTAFIFETHLYSVSENIIKLCRNTLLENKLSVEIGIESANKWTLKYSLNKMIDLSIIDNKLNILKKYNTEAIANILVGSPFLSLSDIIKDAVNSVKWVFTKGFDRCVLFPINIKKWTLVSWLEENKLYNCPSLWAFIEVLNQIPEKYMNEIEIVWFEEREQFNPAYSEKDISPTTCPICYPQVIVLLKQFRSDYSVRKNILHKLNSIQCNCKRVFKEELTNASLTKPNLIKTYKYIALNILGNNYWKKNKDAIISDIVDYQSINITNED